MLGAQHFAVHAIGDDAIIERLAHRNRSVHRRGVAAFRHDPFCIRLEAGLLKQNLQRHAGILHAMHHAVSVLAAIELGAAPFHAGIGGTFEKIDLVDARQPHELVEREDQRLFDEAVQHQPIVGRIDLRNAAVMPLEAQSIRRDDSVELMQWREADRRFGRRGEPRHGTADDVLFVLGWIAVAAHPNALTELTRPVGNIRRKVLGVVGQCGRRSRRSKSSGTGKKAPARSARRVDRVCHRHLRRIALRTVSYRIHFYECNINRR